jgi:energy-coupling factor transport system ATP-binding protein
MLQLTNVSFRYAAAEKPVLQQVSFAVPAGQIVGIIGRAGAGKSTLCAVCAGFMPEFYRGEIVGRVQANGLDAVALHVADLIRSVAMVGSNPFSQISGARLTVFEEVAFGPENLGLPRTEIIERTEWALQAMQLTDLKDRSPYALSGGQQQRMVLAATLALEPKLLILDEPTAQLDPPTTTELAELLRSLAKAGTTLLIAEHRLEWIAALAERIIVLDAGTLLADGPPETVLTDPKLKARQIGWPRQALIAEQARTTGQWPAAQPLPVTLPALQAGLADSWQPPLRDAKPPVGSEALVQLTNVHFQYPSGVKALNGVSLQIAPGQRVALLGRNGAGKSTLVRHLNGLLRPSAGQALVRGVATTQSSVARCAATVGIVFQDVRNQLFAKSVREELRFGPRNLGFAAARIDAAVEQALSDLELQPFADLHPYDLPPALRRLVAIASVLTMETPLLVLDEPTAGLDTHSIGLLTSLIQRLVAHGRSVLVVTHDLDFCFEALDRVVLMQDGQITLDCGWSQLDPQRTALLSTTVGLPLTLQVSGGEEV